MDQRFDCRSGNAARYFSRPAERLVLDGYRIWSSGLARQSNQAISELNALYSEMLGTDRHRPAALALMEFVGTLGLCATCPLHMLDVASNQICRAEILVMGLIAGIQNGDDAAAETCLRALTCEARCDRVALAAGTLAFVLKGYGKTMMPISPDDIRQMLDRDERQRRSLAGRLGLQPPKTTYH